MQKPSRLSFRRQIRHFKNAFFQSDELLFKDLVPKDLMRRTALARKLNGAQKKWA